MLTSVHTCLVDVVDEFVRLEVGRNPFFDDLFDEIVLESNQVRIIVGFVGFFVPSAGKFVEIVTRVHFFVAVPHDPRD